MKGAFVLCEELRSLDGVLGAFILESNECVASSLPVEFNEMRLNEVGKVLCRAQQVVGSGGFDGAALAFHWEKGSLLTWPARDGTVLGLLATPDAVRETLERRAAVVLEQLTQLSSRHVFPPDEVPTRRDNVIPRR
jgi:hypothetical protein